MQEGSAVEVRGGVHGFNQSNCKLCQILRTLLLENPEASLPALNEWGIAKSQKE